MPHNKIEKIAFLNLDVDLYKSYKDCLTYLFPKVVKGGVVLFDEYIEEKKDFPGACKAINEYLKNTSYKLEQNPISKRHFVVKY